VVWCGVVWCGVVWCGAVWCGVVWYGVVHEDVVGTLRMAVRVKAECSARLFSCSLAGPPCSLSISTTTSVTFSPTSCKERRNSQPNQRHQCLAASPLARCGNGAFLSPTHSRVVRNRDNAEMASGNTTSSESPQQEIFLPVLFLLQRVIAGGWVVGGGDQTSRGSTVSMTDAPLVTRSSTIRQFCPALKVPSMAFLVP
jgi:hypothetical protein